MGKKKRLQVHDEYGKPVPQDERKLKEKIVDGLKTPLSECVPESEVEW